jgi:4-hydroxy-tetrahydrodipicolinate reductase
MKLLLVGHGRMGKLVEALAPEYGCEVVAIHDPAIGNETRELAHGHLRGAEVAVDFSTADAVLENAERVAALGLNLVIGTTGWNERRDRVREIAAAAAIGVVAAPNFSTGAVLFGEIVRAASALLVQQGDYGAWLHELHHAAKRDAPSGTALQLKAIMEAAGYDRPVDVAATRAGFIPGTHTVGFDGPSETITLTHAVRDRGTFARGALLAAKWVHGRRGWFTMHDVLGLR